ncbi:hypothetical protein [Peterkaempfera griseoplana]|uniref:hypothetical protein n=1 Tax=Peterkaempfera griseoplana TaxID=66896 RepID=UPI0006E239D1|nr:hypothetical protein [Peterkaempfera griseoplana]
MSQTDHLAQVVAATAQWLTRAYPATAGAFSAALAQAQARQAAMVAARLCYPTAVDEGLLSMLGPQGADRLDWAAGADVAALPDDDYGWRTWVDETVASWAACLLTDPALARAAVAAADLDPCAYRRLTAPDERDRLATALLRHPDLTAPVAALHRARLQERLLPGQREAEPEGSAV